jgi:hypothetical protein
MVDAITLQSSQIIGVSEFRTNLLEPLPIALRPFRADVGMEVAFQDRGDMVIVEQRVVDVKKENDFLVPLL